MSSETPNLVGVRGGSAHYTLGALRVRVRDEGAVEFATAFPDRITAAVSCGDGWLFASDEGVVAYARGFLGPMERVGDFRFPDLSSGHAATVVDEEGSFWSVRCGQHAVLTHESPRHVVAARVVGDQQIVITLFDTQWRTEGQAWTRVDLGDDVALRFSSAGSGEVRIETSGGEYTIDVQGRARPIVEAGEQAREQALDLDRATDAQRISETLRALGLDTGVPTRWFADGSLVVYDPETPFVIRGDGQRVPLPTGCSSIEGARLAFRCGDVVFAAEFDPDTPTLVRRVLGSFEGRAERMLLLADDRMLLEGTVGVEGCDARVCLFDLPRGGGTPLPIDELPVSPNVVGAEALFPSAQHDAWIHVRADGSVEQLAASLDVDLILAPDGVVWSVRRFPDFYESPTTSIDLEREVISLRREGGMEVLAPPGNRLVRVQGDTVYLADEELDSVVRSTDGGQTWVELAPDPRVHGSLPPFYFNALDLSASCEPGPCPVGDRLIYDRALGPFHELPLLGRQIPLTDPPAPDPVRFECLAGTSIDGEPHRDGVLSHRVTRSRHSVMWRGLDEEGSYRSEADLSGFAETCWAQLRQRHTALLLCPHGDPLEPLTEFILARVGRPPLRLTSPFRAGSRPHALFVDDSRGVMLISERIRHHNISLAVAWNGEQVVQRRLHGQSELGNVAWMNDRPALAFRGWGHPLSDLEVYYLDTGELREARVSQPSASCADARDADIVRILPRAISTFSGPSSSESLDAVIVAIGPERTCIRGIEAARLVSAYRGDEVTVMTSRMPQLPYQWDVAGLRGSALQRAERILGPLGAPRRCAWEEGFQSTLEVHVASGNVLVTPRSTREEDNCVAARLREELADRAEHLGEGTFEATFVLGERPPWPLTELRCAKTLDELLSTLN